MENEPEEPPVELSISLDKLAFIIVKAREFDAKTEVDDPESGSDAIDDAERDVLEDLPEEEDATLEELEAAIDDLNDDEVVDLIALAWVGRGDFSREDWPEARKLAAERHRRHSSEYLIGIPNLSEYLEEGLAQLGYSPTELGSDHQ